MTEGRKIKVKVHVKGPPDPMAACTVWGGLNYEVEVDEKKYNKFGKKTQSHE